MKTCIKCKIEQPKTEFYVDRTNAAGLYPQCKACNKAGSREYRIANKDKVTAMKDRWKEADPVRYILCAIKARCKRSGVEFRLTPSDIEMVTHCPILGLKLNYMSKQEKRGLTHANTASIDRIDPTKGYIPGNVTVISWRANKLKSDITLEEMQQFSTYYATVVSR